MPTQRCPTCQKGYFLTPKELLRQRVPDKIVVPCSLKCAESYIFSVPETDSFCPTAPYLLGEDRVIDPSGYRSRYEHDLYSWLYSRFSGVFYEPLTFILPPVKSDSPGHYTPDFVISTREHVFVEAKGLWMPGSKNKLARLLAVYPEIRLILFPWRLNREVARVVKQDSKK